VGIVPALQKTAVAVGDREVAGRDAGRAPLFVGDADVAAMRALSAALAEPSAVAADRDRLGAAIVATLAVVGVAAGHARQAPAPPVARLSSGWMA
jgi:hypothetical protein